MSNSEALNYVQVVCECPHEHLLGTIIKTRSGVYWCDERPMSNSKMDLSGEPMTVGEKVKAACEACAKEARYGTDYQASWTRVAASLSEARDTRAERTTLIFG